MPAPCPEVDGNVPRGTLWIASPRFSDLSLIVPLYNRRTLGCQQNGCTKTVKSGRSMCNMTRSDDQLERKNNLKWKASLFFSLGNTPTANHYVHFIQQASFFGLHPPLSSLYQPHNAIQLMLMAYDLPLFTNLVPAACSPMAMTRLLEQGMGRGGFQINSGRVD